MKRPTLGVVLLAVFLVMQFAATANAATIVLDPGPGTNYLAQWCGGQTVNEIATGFDSEGNAVTLVQVGTTCHGSGRGSPNQYYLACWTVTFAQSGDIVAKVWLATNQWTQGHPAIPCPVTADPGGVYGWTDGAGNFPATLSTIATPANRAQLETTCAAIGYGNTVSGTIGAPGEQGCYSFSGRASANVRVSVVTSGALVAVLDVHSPSGAIRCSSASGSLDCALDPSGLYTVVVRDSSGTATGGYNLTLVCLASTCGANEPHLTISMTGTVTSEFDARAVAYAISVANDGGASAANVVVNDTLPRDLLVRSASSSQGTCSQAGQTVTCSVGSVVPSGGVMVSITAVPAASSSQVSNTACVETTNCITTITNLR